MKPSTRAEFGQARDELAGDVDRELAPTRSEAAAASAARAQRMSVSAGGAHLVGDLGAAAASAASRCALRVVRRLAQALRRGPAAIVALPPRRPCAPQSPSLFSVSASVSELRRRRLALLDDRDRPDGTGSGRGCQTRMRTLTVCRPSVHQSIRIAGRPI